MSVGLFHGGLGCRSPTRQEANAWPRPSIYVSAYSLPTLAYKMANQENLDTLASLADLGSLATFGAIWLFGCHSL